MNWPRAALFSLSDKSGVVEFARALAGHGTRILASGGTAKHIAQAGIECRQRDDDAFEGFALAPEFLRAFGVIPQRRILVQLDQLFEALCLGVVVKDTSAAPPRVLRGHAGGWLWR